jgi:hemolysin III
MLPRSAFILRRETETNCTTGGMMRASDSPPKEGRFSTCACRPRSRGEIVADAIVHAIGLVAAGIGAVVLVAFALHGGAYGALPALALYTLGLFVMLGCSCAYNLAPESPRKERLRQFDQAGIFLMIAGTYTPFTTLSLGGPWAIGLTGFVWLAALAGAGLKLLFPRRFDRLTIAAYLILGWAGGVALAPLTDALGLTTLMLIAVGGVLYSVGVVFHLADRLPFQAAIWHGFVVAAAGVHYAAVLRTLKTVLNA